jgi:hypothetical protein
MESSSVGELVKVSDDGRERDGIVFDTPSSAKVVVAVVDPRRGPVFRTVHPKALAERADAGPDDEALRRLMRRTPPPAQRGARGAAAARSAAAGHTRAPTHRTTGR